MDNADTTVDNGPIVVGVDGCHYGRLFDYAVKAEYERALTAAKAHLGSLPAQPPTGPTMLPIIDSDWKQTPAIKARLAGGFCIRAQVQGPCAYANICEHCPNFRTDAGYLPVLAAQRADAETLAPDAEPRGWGSEAERHRRLIERLDAHIHAAQTRMSSDPMSTHDRRQRVEDAWAALLATGQPVAFDQVATRAGIGRATLYRNPDLRAIVEEHRARGREAHTLTGLSTEIATCASPSTPSPPPSAATNNNSADYAVTTSAPTAEFLRHPTPPKRPGLAG